MNENSNKPKPGSNYQKHTSGNPVIRALIRGFYRHLIDLLKAHHPSPSSILDAGCGEGFTLDVLRKKFPSAFLQGVDISEPALQMARDQFPCLNVSSGDIHQLPFLDQAFELVVCTEVLEHLAQPASALKELCRVSKRYVLLSVPDEPWFSIGNLLSGRYLKRFGNNPEHVQRWSSKGFIRFTRIPDLKLIAVRRPFPWTLLLLEKT